jgi:pyridoxal phosphate enzyme (YggS family)
VNDPRLDRLRQNLVSLQAGIEAARVRGAHAAPAVELLVVSKSAPPAWLPLLARAGVRAVAENRVQAGEARRKDAPAGLSWHLIGHLQRNKVRAACDTFDIFHALDSLELARAISRVRAGNPAPWPVYIQVNAADDPRKGGIAPSEVSSFVKALADLPHLLPLGFMTLGRLGASEAQTRAAFRTLREVRDTACREASLPSPPSGLSMGMSDDFPLAVEEGATVVRLGTAVFEGLAEAEATLVRGDAR